MTATAFTVSDLADVLATLPSDMQIYTEDDGGTYMVLGVEVIMRPMGVEVDFRG